MAKTELLLFTLSYKSIQAEMDWTSPRSSKNPRDGSKTGINSGQGLFCISAIRQACKVVDEKFVKATMATTKSATCLL